MKKFFLLVLVLGVAFSLSACNKKADDGVISVENNELDIQEVEVDTSVQDFEQVDQLDSELSDLLSYIIPTVYAEVTDFTSLKSLAESLKKQVQEETLSKEEARTQWKTALDEYRTIKQKEIMDKIEKMKETNPEMAEKIQTRLNYVKEQRANRKSLREKFKNGEIDKESYKKQKQEQREAYKNKLKAHREEVSNLRSERRNAKIQAKIDNGEITQEQADKMKQRQGKFRGKIKNEGYKKAMEDRGNKINENKMKLETKLENLPEGAKGRERIEKRLEKVNRNSENWEKKKDRKYDRKQERGAREGMGIFRDK